MPPKDAERMANSVDPDQTALKSSLIRLYTICSDIHVPIFRIFTVYHIFSLCVLTGMAVYGLFFSLVNMYFMRIL